MTAGLLFFPLVALVLGFFLRPIYRCAHQLSERSEEARWQVKVRLDSKTLEEDIACKKFQTILISYKKKYPKIKQSGICERLEF